MRLVRLVPCPAPALRSLLVGAALGATLACGHHETPTPLSPSGNGGSFHGAGLSDQDCYAGGSSLALTGHLEAADEAALRHAQSLNAALPQGLRAELVATSAAAAGATHYEYRYMVGNVPLCGEGPLVHEVGGHVFYEHELGSAARQAQAYDSTNLRWGPVQDVLALAAAQLGMPTPLAARQATACLWVDGQTLRPSWQFLANFGGRPYQVVGDSVGVARVSLRSHSATGEATVYGNGSGETELTSVPLTNLGSGLGLGSSSFTTTLDDGSAAATSADRHYDFAATDSRFVEVSLFTHAEQMRTWLESPLHKYKMTCLPLVLHAHTTFNFYGDSNVNNAMYTGGDATDDGRAMIQVGDGDGVTLVNLGTDFDVVAHELGHHVLYRKLKARDGDSGVIHEGVADYLVFAQTGNSCLGGTICPQGSDQCVVPGSCLRTADNEMKLTDTDLPTEVHQRSQFLSGMLWDLGQEPGFTQELVAELVIGGVDYMPADSAYSDFVKALMSADMEANRGIHSCQVYAEAINRGLAGELSGVDCQNYVSR